MNTLVTTKFYHIRNVSAQKLLNIYAGYSDNGTNVCLWEPDNSTEQKWRLEGDAHQGTQYLHSVVDADKVLDFYAAQDQYANADIWEMNAPKYQQLTIEEMSDSNQYQIRLTSNPEMVLTAKGAVNNSNVCWEYERPGDTSQLWEFTIVPVEIREGLDTAAACDEATIDSVFRNPNQYDFICRYYCANQASSKILTKSEAKRISNFLNIVCVYQDANNQAEHFSYIIGQDDARNALNYAMSTIEQPAGSAIYFAVDFNPDSNLVRQNIVPYFQGIQSVFDTSQSPYKIGVYGSGLVCQTIKDMGLADYTWLAQSTAYYGTSDYNDPKRYNIRQGCHVKLNNILFDSNASGLAKNFGQWRFK